MSTNEIHNINAEYSPLILNAPKLKFKKVTIAPTPFSLNDSFSDEEDKEHLRKRVLSKYLNCYRIFMENKKKFHYILMI